MAEIAYYQPRTIVCLSGLGYAAHLLARAKFTVRNTPLIKYAGDVRREDDVNYRGFLEERCKRIVRVIQEAWEKLEGNQLKVRVCLRFQIQL